MGVKCNQFKKKQGSYVSDQALRLLIILINCFLLLICLLSVIPAEARRRGSKVLLVDSVLVEDARAPEVTLMIPLKVERQVKNKPLVKARILNVNQLYAGNPSYVNLVTFNTTTGEKIWVSNNSFKISKKRKDKNILLELPAFEEIEQSYETILFDDKGRKINTYRYAFEMEDFLEPAAEEDFEAADEPSDPDLNQLQDFLWGNVFVKKNRATISKGEGDIFFIDFPRKKRRNKEPAKLQAIDDLGAINDDPDEGPELPIIIGQPGPPGPPGLPGAPGADGIDGVDGVDGVDGIAPPPPAGGGGGSGGGGPAFPGGADFDIVFLPNNSNIQTSIIDLNNVAAGPTKATRVSLQSTAVSGFLVVRLNLAADLTPIDFSIAGVQTVFGVAPVDAGSAFCVPNQAFCFFIDITNGTINLTNQNSFPTLAPPSFAPKAIEIKATP